MKNNMKPGFQRNQACQTRALWSEAIQNAIDAIYLDFSKTFDKNLN